MARTYGVAIIGLGVIGRRMLNNMPRQGRLEIIGGWDSSVAARDAAKSDYPWLRIADDAESLIADPATDLVYIGVPPVAHRPYALATMTAGKAVFCEKPLGVDMADSLDLTERMEQSGLPQAVNFVFGAARGAEDLRKALEKGKAGAVTGVDIRIHFAKWPRGWQENAAWLGERTEGGFTREVMSHYLFLTEKLFGKARLVDRSVRYPDSPADAAETHMLARLDCAGIPVTMAGSVGGAGPDLVEYLVWGSQRSYRLANWYGLETSEGGDWQATVTGIDDMALDSYMLQLHGLVDMLDGKPHRLPDFRAALSVQEGIEAILRD